MINSRDLATMVNTLISFPSCQIDTVARSCGLASTKNMGKFVADITFVPFFFLFTGETQPAFPSSLTRPDSIIIPHCSTERSLMR